MGVEVGVGEFVEVGTGVEAAASSAAPGYADKLAISGGGVGLRDAETICVGGGGVLVGSCSVNNVSASGLSVVGTIRIGVSSGGIPDTIVSLQPVKPAEIARIMPQQHNNTVYR